MAYPHESPAGFNPLPPPKRGETPHHNGQLLAWRVSIRSPRRNEGRRDRAGPCARPLRFQSAPPAETRGDPARSPRVFRGILVSIRSPRRNEGRPTGIFCRRRRARCFNPLPPPKRGETRFRGSSPCTRGCFNPLPPPKRGETSGRVMRPATATRFNPLPPPKRGETTRKGPVDHPRRVSIRSPRRNEGRLVHWLEA